MIVLVGNVEVANAIRRNPMRVINLGHRREATTTAGACYSSTRDGGDDRDVADSQGETGAGTQHSVAHCQRQERRAGQIGGWDDCDGASGTATTKDDVTRRHEGRI